MSDGKFEKELVEPYYPDKFIPPEYIRDILKEANKDFPVIESDIQVPHKWPLEEYKERYETMESELIEILKWRVKWLGKIEIHE